MIEIFFLLIAFIIGTFLKISPKKIFLLGLIFLVLSGLSLMVERQKVFYYFSLISFLLIFLGTLIYLKEQFYE